MRYSVISEELSITQLEDETKRYGGRNLRVASALKQIFCELEPSAVEKLKMIPGLTVKPIEEVKHQQISTSPLKPTTWSTYHPKQSPLETMYAQQPIYAASQVSIVSQFYYLRDILDPPVIGSGFTVVVLDSGIRKTHRGLVGKVVYEANFSSSDTPNDIFSHGTAVAFMAAGGRHVAGEESGIAPGASLMSIKVLGDDGIGTDESVVLGLEEVARLWSEAQSKGLPANDPMYPNIINMSWGKNDTGDPDDPIRLAINSLLKDRPDMAAYAAAGNTGPNPGTVILPASMDNVAAIGALTFAPFGVWQYSGRGPTWDGLVKPDYTFLGVDLILASAKGDDSFEMKSGTSFASPCFAGQWALALEGIPRILPQAVVEALLMTPGGKWAAMWEPIIQATCVKPTGAPFQKDNDYGYGMPYGSLMVKQMQSFTSPAITPIIESLTPILAIGMVANIMKGMR